MADQNKNIPLKCHFSNFTNKILFDRRNVTECHQSHLHEAGQQTKATFWSDTSR